MTSQPQLKVFYSDTFALPLPKGHRFPIEKYRLLRERLQKSAFRDQLAFRLPPRATDEQLLRVHTSEYLDKLKQGTLSRVEERRIGFPWSPEMVERARRSTGATISAAYAAVKEGAAVHLAGGTHHAFSDHGQGFCVFNDVAVAIRALQCDRLIRRAVVIDLDVHQGNGTASIFANDPSVFTFSMHGEHNFPFDKCAGDFEVALPNNTSDEPYLDALRDALENRLPFPNADIVFFLAGADPFEHDRLGRLSLTKTGLAIRDQRVFQACQRHSVPITLIMAGGYAKDVSDVVDINFTSVRSLVGVPEWG